jgi:regulator of sigma E protease
MYIALAIASLGFLIVVHEGGHYFVARWCKMRIERFSIGFGPGVLKRKSKKTGTTFQLAPIPFGGFVEIRGMNVVEEVDPDDAFAYPNRPTWQRFVTIFAGPATNYVSAILLAFALYTCHGEPSAERWYAVDEILASYDAAGKLQPGDRILAVDDVPILASQIVPRTLAERVHAKAGAPVVLTVRRDGKPVDLWVVPRLGNNGYEVSGMLRPGDRVITVDDLPLDAPGQEESLADRVNAKKGQSVLLTIRRNGHVYDVSVTPKLGRDEDGKQLKDSNGNPMYLLGFKKTLSSNTVEVGVLTAGKDALMFPIVETKVIATVLYGIVFGGEKADPGGPKRMVDEFTKAFKAGFVPGIELLMMLSVYLGLFNLFPLPALDGGRLVFLTYEMVTRRRANPKIEAVVHMAGIMVLGVVMILVTLRDFHVL